MAEDQRQLGQVPPAEKRMLQHRCLTPFIDFHTAVTNAQEPIYLNANIKANQWGSSSKTGADSQEETAAEPKRRDETRSNPPLHPATTHSGSEKNPEFDVV